MYCLELEKVSLEKMMSSKVKLEKVSVDNSGKIFEENIRKDKRN